MLIVRTVVSRKTPMDGRLEIPASLAGRLQALETPLSLSMGSDEHDVAVEDMPCNCKKALAGGQHVHHFLTSEALKHLAPDTNVSVTVDVDSGQIEIETES